MKFLCDNCKTKYRIADEKAAGKTIRMKCQKCGHQIEVRAEVTETSVSTSTMPPAIQMLDSKPAPRPSLATSLATQKPRPSQAVPPGSALAGAFQRSVQTSAPPALGNDSSALDVNVTDEWYVAINGVPVGPVRISEIRRKAASGAVTEESLCWQEGLEEWRPIRSVPELAAIVREAAQGNRASLVGPPPETRPPAASVPPRPPQRPAPPAPRPGGVSPPRAPVPRSNVVPFQGRSPSGERPMVEERRLSSSPAFGAVALAPQESLPVPAPLGTPAPALAEPIAAPPPPAAEVAPDPFGMSAVASPFASGASGASGVSGAVPTSSAAAALTETASATPSLVAPPPTAKRAPVPLWFWAVVLFVVPFGITAAFFLFKPPPQPIVVQVPVSTPTPTTPAPPVATEAPAPTASAPIPEPTASAPAATSRPAVAAAKAPATTSTERKTVDVSGLLGGTSGPSTGGSGSGGSSGGGLDSSSVERVVRERQASVKRTCWERSGTQKSSANVTVAVTVAPNGSVSNANATGDDPVVAKCIENQVRGWSFPAPGSTTTVNVPFHFVRQ